MSFSPEDPPTGTEFIEQTLAAPKHAEEAKLRDDFRLFTRISESTDMKGA